MLHPGEKVGIVGCSGGRAERERSLLAMLGDRLGAMGLEPVWSPYLYAQDGTPCSAPPRQRAEALTELLEDDAIAAVFDVSGGDGANGLLEYLDFDRLAAHPKPFWGYSDLTALLNPLWERSGMACGLYQIKNLVLDLTGNQLRNFRDTVLDGGSSLYDIPWRFLQGSAMEGVVLGGNLRCLLKLAGTPWFPDLTGKLLFLESLGGGPARIEAYFRQLRQMGVLDRIAGLLLGTFTELDRLDPAWAERLALEAANNPHLPVARTDRVGHGNDARCLRLGQQYRIESAF